MWTLPTPLSRSWEGCGGCGIKRNCETSSVSGPTGKHDSRRFLRVSWIPGRVGMNLYSNMFCWLQRAGCSPGIEQGANVTCPVSSYWWRNWGLVLIIQRNYTLILTKIVINYIYLELGELPIMTLHKMAQKREDTSGKFYPEERGLARVCNPIGR